MFKKLIATIGFLLFFGMLISFSSYYRNIDGGMKLVELNTEAKMIAVNRFFSQLESIGTISITLIGVLWAFIIYGASRVKIKRLTEKCLFVQSNLFLLISFATCFFSERFLIGRLFYHSTIDLNAPIVNFGLSMQQSFFISGLIWSVLTILVSLKEERNQ